MLAGSLIVGSISGACFNPAVAMLAVMNKNASRVWIYFVGPLSGGVLAGLLFKITHPSEIGEADIISKHIARRSHSHHNPDGILIRTLAMLVMEFLGTLILAYHVGMSSNSPEGADFVAIGFILISLVYACGAVCGSHFNPAVSCAVFMKGYLNQTGYIRFLDTFYYIIVQILGAVTGAAIAAYVNGGRQTLAYPTINTDEHTLLAAFVSEVLFSFLLMLCVLCVAGNKKVSGNSYFGLAVGFVVISGIGTVGDVSGAVFNPAIGIALPLIAADRVHDMWVYVLGPTLGCLISLAFFHLWFYDENLASYQHTFIQSEDSEVEGLLG